MPIFSKLMFRAVHWAARRGLREEENFSSDAKKLEARRTGVRGETYAYWYLRRQGYNLLALPALSVTRKKQHLVVRTAQRFLTERHVGACPCRFDVMAIDNCPGQPPVVRLHKDAFSPQM
jgi:Holliday junction resolvase-like predicted endonuclease